MQLSQSIDLIIGVAVVVVSGISSTYAYRSVVQSEKPPYTLTEQLKEGSHSYVIMSKETCVGKLTTDLRHQKAYEILVEGVLRASYGKQVIHAKVRSWAYFNPLGQLVQSKFAIESQDNKFSLKSSGVTPIEFTADLNVFDNKVEQDFTIDGPVLLNKIGEGTYQIEHPGLSSFSQGYTGIISKPLQNELQLRFVKEEEATSCAGDTMSRLDLTKLITTLGKTFGAWNSLLTGGEND